MFTCSYFPLCLGLAVLKHVLTPRMKASYVATESMKPHLDAIYDVTVAYDGTLMADGQRRTAPSMPGTVVLQSKSTIGFSTIKQ